MHKTLLTLTFLAILAVVATPALPAADAGTETDGATAPLTLDPTQNALTVDVFETCADEDLETTSFTQEPDEQVCVDYCHDNGWTFVEYWYFGRSAYGCFCCSA